MIHVVSGETAKHKRELFIPGVIWRTEYIGTRPKQVEDKPQAFLVEMDANAVIVPHFHEVDQFQVFVAGHGSLGRNAAPVIALHYVDHHTGYGPINAGPCGLSYFTIRARSDPGAVYLDRPGYRDKLKPSKKRYVFAGDIWLSTEPVLQNRSGVALENAFKEVACSDGLGAFMLRLGADMKTTGPDPRATTGQFCLVVNGSLQFDGERYAAWSTVYAGPTDAPLELCAGPQGLEAIILNFPRAPA